MQTKYCFIAFVLFSQCYCCSRAFSVASSTKNDLFTGGESPYSIYYILLDPLRSKSCISCLIVSSYPIYLIHNDCYGFLTTFKLHFMNCIVLRIYLPYA